MRILSLAICLAAAASLSACGGSRNVQQQVVADVAGGVNPYLWRASLDTLEEMPVSSADPLGGLIVYDWRTFPDAPSERIKATVYILDTRLRADGINVAVFRQTNQGGTWTDATVDPETEEQIENAILSRARSLKAAEIG